MVIFDSVKHTYTNPETNKIYISVSQLLKKYKEPFDSDFFASKIAKRDGKTKEQVLELWEKNNKAACDKGQDLHDAFENFFKTGSIDKKYFKQATEFRKVFDINDYKTVNSEIIISSDEHEIAGTSDIIADVDDTYFDVLDFKTNKKFLFYSKYGKHLKYPLNNLQECQYNDYSLQLSLYAYLYSVVTNKKVRQISILYYDGNQFHKYPVPYLFWEVTVLIKHYGQTLSSKSKDLTIRV